MHDLIDAYQNRIWLLDVASKLPPSSQLDGFDITNIHFPHQDFLYKNMSLGVMDIMNGPPQQLLEKYDIVHVRFFSSQEHGTNPAGMLKNCLKILSKRLHLVSILFLTCFLPQNQEDIFNGMNSIAWQVESWSQPGLLEPVLSSD